MSKYNKEYFSDDEKSENDNTDTINNLSKDKNEDLSGYEESEDESMDEETRNIIFNKISNINYEMNQESPINESKKKIKNKEKNTKQLSLIDFNKKIADESKNKQTKKFISKRVNDKKKVLGIVEELPKRTFNPRLPPYNFVHNINDRKVEENININNNEAFPTL
jgi:hypothetical protein